MKFPGLTNSMWLAKECTKFLLTDITESPNWMSRLIMEITDSGSLVVSGLHS